MADRQRSGSVTSALAPLLSVFAALVAPLPGAAADWPHWRGPFHDGTSPERQLVADWSPEGLNLLWRADHVGRSTPVVVAGRVCANGRAGEDLARQEMVACYDAATGERLWERRFNVYQTTVPWNRVGWANLAADPETGYLYVQGVGGLFFCLDSRDGSVVWSHQLMEELGFLEGYGGRTQTPLVDEGRVLVTFASSGWGDQARPLHRLFAFDKRTGELLWVSSPASDMADKNAQSTPAVAVVDGERLLVHGNGSGWIYAVQARTGAKVWEFHLSQRGINTTPLVDGTTVYAAHSEENVDEGTMGRVVAIDARGRGDVTATHELWRAPLGVGFASPALVGGRLYVVDNAARLFALDAKSGAPLWDLKVGRIGRGSPVVADGHIYVTEVNGGVHVVAPGEEDGRLESSRQVTLPGGRYAEIWGSPAIAGGRIYFTSEAGLFCLGSEASVAANAGAPAPALALPEEGEAAGPAARLLAMPYEVLLRPGDEQVFRLEAFDAKGRSLGNVEGEWSVEGLAAAMDASGRLVVSDDAPSQAGLLRTRRGDLEATARVRILEPLPLEEDFESVPVGSRPSYLVGFPGRFEVREVEGGKVLAKGPSPTQVDRHITFLGHPGESGYTIETRLLATREEHRVPDVGLINGGYTLELMGAHQQLELRDWAAALRFVERVDFPWQADTWYRMKFSVDVGEVGARVRAKVWPAVEPEPAAWTLEAEDPAPIREGAPGLSAYSPAFVYYDDVRVTRNSP